MDRLAAMHAFVRLVEVGTFSAVADELRIKQSTVSKWLAALEAEFGIQLVDRTTRSQRVTEAGQLFYRRAKEMLATYADTAAQLHSQDAEPRGRIRVSVPVVFGRLFVVPQVARFMRRYRQVEIELVFDDRYVNLVEEGFDLSFRTGLPTDSTLRALKIGDPMRRLVASPGYVQQSGRPEAPADLQHHECLLHSGLSARDTWVFRHAGKPVHVTVRGRFSANNSEALLAMARSGLGIALLSSWLVDLEVRSGRLVTLLPDHELPAAPVQALMPPGRHIHPRIRTFLDFMSAALRPIIAPT
jgi:DNA-binding transcriptional LysR family regulator